MFGKIARPLVWIISATVFFSIAGCESKKESAENNRSTKNKIAEPQMDHQSDSDGKNQVQAVSLLGRELISKPPPSELVAQFEKHRSNYLAQPQNADLLIWYARFVAYQGKYKEAIDLFSRGVEQFPDDPRFLRHRGHRFISIREFDKAIADLSHAAKIIHGSADQTEPDGMPNSQNIPVSSLHTNIWYHLALAYYLKNDLEKATDAYDSGLAACQNDDMRVAFTHWAYMTQRQLGNENTARQLLQGIKKEMHVIESFDYHKLCLMYKGEMTIDEIKNQDTHKSQGSTEALLYGIANWHLYHDDRTTAKQLLKELADAESWAAFGCIAAEATYAREFKKDSP